MQGCRVTTLTNGAFSTGLNIAACIITTFTDNGHDTVRDQYTSQTYAVGPVTVRGSREYNLALGQKRADAVRKALSLLGAKEDQLEAVSLGEEKPVCTESTEECWAKNRRGDMLYSGEF